MASEDNAEKERNRGKVFTDAQRDYLYGKEVSENYASTLDTRIKQRVTGLLEDLQLLKDLDRKQREYIYRSNKLPEREGNTVYTENGLMNLPAKGIGKKEGPIGLFFAFMSFYEFFHRTMRENGASIEDQCSHLQYALKRSEQLAMNDLNEGRYEIEASVQIDEVNRLDTDEALEDAKERFQENGIKAVTSEELKALAESDYITLHGNWE